MKRWVVDAVGRTNSHFRALVQAAAVVVAAPTGGAAGAEADASASPDKSDYTLFNPTPRDRLREMSTDRPDKTESPFTVDAGHFQIETLVDVERTMRAFEVWNDEPFEPELAFEDTV